jgi:hypothetical protein
VIGEQEDVGILRLDVAEIQPLRREVRDHRLGARIGEHALDLRAEHVRVVQPAVERRCQQIFVRDAAPEEEREPRRELDVADRYDADRRVVSGGARRSPGAPGSSVGRIARGA